MTNEEIKNKLQRGLALTVKESWDLYKYIEALEQQTCDDCVSREAIRNVLIRDNEMNGYSDRTHNLMEKLFDLPSVTPQEPILDKIRAEIKSKIVKRPWLDFKDRERDRNDAFLEVLDIINKYKAESEVVK